MTSKPCTSLKVQLPCKLISSVNSYRSAHQFCNALCFTANRLAGLVVKASASGAEDPGFESCLRRDFSGSSHTSD